MEEMNKVLITFEDKIGMFTNSASNSTTMLSLEQNSDYQTMIKERIEISATLVTDAINDRSIGHKTDKTARTLLRIKYGIGN